MKKIRKFILILVVLLLLFVLIYPILKKQYNINLEFNIPNSEIISDTIVNNVEKL